VKAGDNMRSICAIGALVFALGAAFPAQRRNLELENVAAMARLYGVVRYFYPGDAAAALDWNRFALHASREVLSARNREELASRLNSLFAQVGGGIVVAAALPPAPHGGAADSTLVAWRYFGAAVTRSAMPGPYRAKRTRRALIVPGTLDGFAAQMQAMPAIDLRGRSIRLRALARAEPHDENGSASLWLRVDRVGGQPGFFDNMADRPIRARAWREYTIAGEVAGDATSVVFGIAALGAVVADFDAIALETRVDGGAWAPLPIKDAGFENVWLLGGWSAAGTSKRARVTRPAEGAPEGKQFLRIASAEDTVTTAELFDEGTPVSGAHADVELGAGLRARVPLALADTEASVTPASLQTLTSALAALPDAPSSTDLDTRLADTVVAWNAFRHFYPYWPEARIDWNTRLVPLLDEARNAATREQHHNALRKLVADVGDGHGFVSDTRNRLRRSMLPVQMRVIENRVVITASDVPAVAPVGAAVMTIDEVPAAKRLSDLVRLASGTEQWRQVRALNEMISCAPGAQVVVSLDAGQGPRRETLACTATQTAAEKRPPPIAELRPSVWYVDLTRARAQDLIAELHTLADGKGVVFDVRGYPTDSGARILPHLVATSERDRWMHIAKLVGPHGEAAAWHSVGWDLQPAAPHINGRVVFLTDGRAISYAESVMGYVADRKLGTIVGAPTAGANGNVVTFPVPGGFTIAFTGMRVTRHDGVSPHHLAGIQPDILLAPTIAAIRAGRDELLEKAIGIIEQK
jgi:peptidase S41-like protein